MPESLQVENTSLPDGNVRVGLCGFTMSMEDYALYFPVIEIQNTFYEPPRDEVMREWRAVTAASLEYTMKVWQLVTHVASSPTYRRVKNPLPPGAEPGGFRDSPAVEEGWRRSLECATILGATRVASQSPAYVMFNNMPRIGDAKRFIRLIAQDLVPE